MTFELFVKGMHGGNLDSDSVSINKSSITLGQNISSFLEGDYIEIYLDREHNKIGLFSSNDKIKGFKKQNKKNQATQSIVSAFVRMIPRGRYVTHFEGDFVVFEVEEIAQDKRLIS